MGLFLTAGAFSWLVLFWHMSADALRIYRLVNFSLDTKKGGGLSWYMLQEVASLGAPLFALFEHPAPRLLDGVALMMRAVAEGGVLAAAPMREAALAEGALLSHLLLACTQQVPLRHSTPPTSPPRPTPQPQFTC